MTARTDKLIRSTVSTILTEIETQEQIERRREPQSWTQQERRRRLLRKCARALQQMDTDLARELAERLEPRVTRLSIFQQ
jgi:acyl-CoA reductase-like NAD-dependent aldehyde dehydrogenase